MAPRRRWSLLQEDAAGSHESSNNSPGRFLRQASLSSQSSEILPARPGSPPAGHVNAMRRMRRASTSTLRAIAAGSDVGSMPSPISKDSDCGASTWSPSNFRLRSRAPSSTPGDPHSPDSTGSCESPSAGRSNPAKKHLLSRIAYESPTRSQGYEGGLRPLAAFLKHFVGRAQRADENDEGSGVAPDNAARDSLKLWVPDTVVWEEGALPVWYYSDEHGHVARTHNFKMQDVTRRFQRKQAPDQVVAVMKRPLQGVRNQTTLMDSKRLGEFLKIAEAPVVMQRFIRSRDHPSLLRCCWKRAMACDIQRISNIRGLEAYIGDEAKLLVSLYRKPASTFEVNAVVGMLRAQLSDIMDHIVRYLATERGMLFDEFVCDFIRDETQRLWLLQVKAFTKRPWEPEWPGPAVWSGEPQEPGDRARCGLCECTFRLGDLRSALNARQLHKVHERLRRWRGSLSWAPGSGALIARDATTYQIFHVCDDCYSLHCALEDLARTAAAFDSFLEVPGPRNATGNIRDEDTLGVYASWEDASDNDAASSKFSGSGSWTDTKHAAVALSPLLVKAPYQDEHWVSPPSQGRKNSLPQFSLNTRERLLAKTCEQDMPPPMPFDWQCPLERLSTQAVVHTKRQGSLLRFRLLVFVHSLRGDVEQLHEVSAEHGLLCLTWSLFGAKRCVALQLDAEPSEQEQMCCTLPVHALGSQHLFSSCPEAASEWISDCHHLAMYLVAVASGQRLACASFDLRHVVKEKLEQESFEVPMRGIDGMTLWIRATLGFGGGAAFDCERVQLTTHTPGRVYIPQSSITGPEALPNSWLGLLSGVKLPMSTLDISRQIARAH